jgi:hypothetical protein
MPMKLPPEKRCVLAFSPLPVSSLLRNNDQSGRTGNN